MRKLALSVAAVALAAGMAATAAPANARTPVGHSGRTFVAGTRAGSPLHSYSSWLGQCFASRGNAFAGGWCDGNGPNWTYQGFVSCSNGYTYVGVMHWAGDRRGSYGQCPSGSSSSLGGLDIYHNGVYQYSVV